LRALKILIVDDEESLRVFVTEALRGCGYELSSVTSGKQALELANKDNFDLIFCDAMVAGESGFSLITSMKSNPTISDIPVILWTVLEQLNGGVLDSSGKADIKMSKPFNLPNIMDSLTRAKQMLRPGLEILF
jgi:CheY-like chemotaxis protein